MLVGELETTLTPEEMEFARRQLGREPNGLEWAMIDAEWSEHCSYKSSKHMLATLPTSGSNVLVGPGYDSGVVDIGDGYVVTMHIESHNHPSAIDPYGGAATGIGGVVRDILCMGTTPIAFLDALKFGEIAESDHSKWIMKNVVRGIADYGNCIGVPTVAGELEFDICFERNCLVDVACLGVGRKEELLLAQATHIGDGVYLIGGCTGRDGIHGSTFASRSLGADPDQDRSAVQIPDPFTKKLIIEVSLEAARARILRGCKDLGGGGLATGLSEIADKGGTGLNVYLEKVPIREADMTPIEILISESQERMLFVVKEGSDGALDGIVRKYGVGSARIGEVTSTGRIMVFRLKEQLANLSTPLLANAPTIRRKGRMPRLRNLEPAPAHSSDLGKSLLGVLAAPTIASKDWVFRQYDHEVGIGTIAKPGEADAAALKLPNGKYAAVKVDGNARFCDLDPYVGAAGVLAECCRNVVAVGAEPVAFLDHCQFGDPNDEEIFWAFSRAIEGIADFARAYPLPCVGGKVSFYNQEEQNRKAIKSSPVISVLGLIEKANRLTKMGFRDDGEVVIIVGETKPELGGSEYYHTLGCVGKEPPSLDFELEVRTQRSVLECIRNGLVSACHDISKGGLGVAVAEMAIAGGRGASVDCAPLYAKKMHSDELLFSETNSRFIITTKNPSHVSETLSRANVPAIVAGTVGGDSLHFGLGYSRLDFSLETLREAYMDSLQGILEP
ncbi:MAG: phosphoribosylformylglycinamidine synthase subunit PurL [Candidatus Bathyarchaeia archaeon]